MSPSPVRAIRVFCVQCVGGAKKDVRECAAECPLHPFRMGTNPNRAGIGGKGGLIPAKISKKKAAQVLKSTPAVDPEDQCRRNVAGTALPASKRRTIEEAVKTILREISAPEGNP